MSNYRSRIYENYPQLMQQNNGKFDQKKALQIAKSYNYYLRNWLPVNKSSSICDVGCGSGYLLYHLKSLGYSKLYGVDISNAQINRTKSIGVSAEKADAVEFLQLHSLQYDFILAIDIIEHLSKNKTIKFLDACYNALCAGGRLVIQTPNPESPWGAQIVYGDLTHETAFTPHLLKKLLNSFHFKFIQLRETGPVVHGVNSLIRIMLWKTIHLGLKIWNMAETGDKGSGIYTRVFLISGIK